MLKWIVQSNLIKTEVLEEFRNAFKNLAIEFEEVTVVPFSDTLPHFTAKEINIFYGSTTLMLNAYNSEKFRKGVFYSPENFNVKKYLQKWQGEMLNQDGVVLSFKDFMKTKIDKQEKWFIRPNSDTKSFAGKLMDTSEIKEWYHKILNIDNPLLNSNTLISVAKPKFIKKEWRNFIVNKKVIDSSRYILNGTLNISTQDIPKEMLEYTEKRILEYSPHPIFVIDIAEIDIGFKIIECNCFNGTGFYKHNIKQIVKSITDFL